MAFGLIFAAVGTLAILYSRAATAPAGLIRNGVGTCLDVKREQFVNSTPVQLYACHNGSGQQWSFETDGTIRVRGLCLDAKRAGKAPMTPVQIYRCNGGINQKWRTSGASIINQNANLCLDDKRNNPANSAPVQLYGCNGGIGQRWSWPRTSTAPPAASPNVTGGWSWENPSQTASYQLAGDSITLAPGANNDQWTNANRAPRLLRAMPAGDWTIETHVGANSGPGQSFAGLTVFKSGSDWLLWGQLGNSSLEGSGIIGNQPTQPFTSMASKFSYLRLRKVGTTYYLDGSQTGSVWNNANIYRDTAGRLNGARIGLLAKGWGNAYSVKFDYFRQYAGDVMPSAMRDAVATRQVSKQTGWDAINDTRKANFCGTDLGEMFHWQNRIYTVFGDTNRCDGRPFPSNVMSYTTDTNAADGVRYTGWVGGGRELFPEDPGGITAIPTNGIGIGNRAYIYYMNVNNWGPPAPTKWTCNRSSIATATSNNDAAWSKQPISWGGTSNFGVVAVQQVDNTVYAWGVPCGRFGSVELMKVDSGSILNKNAYQYLSGYNGDGSPQWSGSEGSAITVAGGPVGELSVIYNKWLGRYVMAYLDERKAAIVMRESPTPWGNWSAPVTLTTAAQHAQLYGGFMDPTYVGNNGQDVYWMMSMFGPYNTYLMKSTLVKR